MNLLKFVFFSSLEYFSSFVFILVQFRFPLKENIVKIVLISLLLSFVSYSFINADLSTISPVIQIIILLIYIQVVLKVNIINSIIMVFTSYIVYGLVQTCLIAAFTHVGLIAGELKAETNTAFILQVSSCLLVLLICSLNYYFKGGFSFIEARSRFSKNSFTGKNKGFIGYIFLALVITVFSNIVILESPNPPYLPIAAILLITLFVLFYLSLKRDESVD
ncbi:hypothetical protein ACFPPD_13835 [Cohnella suwonensis]|uniref:Uncharacterized protein n=1 Tax=Cohnella suwonensis TaxID=696072 RepID=A0ABW0LX23_9BACL